MKQTLLLTLTLTLGAAALRAEPAARPFTIAYAPDCQAVADQVAAAAQAGRQPLLRAFAVNSAPLTVTPLADLTPAQRLGHLVLIGRPDAPVINEAWQQEARPVDGGLYIFGHGYWRGDIGYLEAGRNPFLYGSERKTKGRDFHAEIVTISGNTLKGVETAARAFLDKSIVNGAVSDNAVAIQDSLLNRPPLTLAQIAALPPAPKTPAGLDFLAITLPSEVEYRNAREILGVTPLTMVRYKYLPTGSGFPLTAAEHDDSFPLYHHGLHRKATGRTLLVVTFDPPGLAQTAADAFGKQARLRDGKGQQPDFLPGWSNLNPGPLSITVKAPQLLISTLE